MAGRVDNLRPWRKGESGNPGGRPKTAHISEALRAALESGKADELASVLLALATGRKKGTSVQIAALREIADRTEGRVAIAETKTETQKDGIWLTVERMDEIIHRGEESLRG